MNPSDIAASQASAAAAAAPGAASAAAIPFLRHDEGAWESSGIGVGNALATILLLLAAGAWVAHRAGWLRRGGGAVALQRVLGASSGEGLRVLESTRLTPKASAHVLQWGGKRVLVVCTEQNAIVAAQDGGAAAASSAPAGDAS